MNGGRLDFGFLLLGWHIDVSEGGRDAGACLMAELTDQASYHCSEPPRPEKERRCAVTNSTATIVSIQRI